MKKTEQDKMLRDIFLAFVRVHLLHHASAERIYGLEMIEELRLHGYEMSPGTLYPILHGLEERGYLRSEQELANGKVRKYYRATAAGRKLLEQLKSKIRELEHEVLGP
jgi:DNA-binding PadR family transcriptional regulator